MEQQAKAFLAFAKQEELPVGIITRDNDSNYRQTFDKVFVQLQGQVTRIRRACEKEQFGEFGFGLIFFSGFESLDALCLGMPFQRRFLQLCSTSNKFGAINSERQFLINRHGTMSYLRATYGALKAFSAFH
jgi:hypothetical protein